MSAPTTAVRRAVYVRDRHACVACGALGGLTFQHRQAVGMGGSRRRVGAQEGLTLCLLCNQGCEAWGQRDALRFGWKVPRWVGDPARVPVWYAREGRWCRLYGAGRVEVSRAEAREMFRAVYGPEEWKDEER